MRTNHSRIIEIKNMYDVDVIFESGGCIVYYLNTQETDVIPFTEEIDMNFVLDNFEMVSDMSKLQMNLYEPHY